MLKYLSYIKEFFLGTLFPPYCVNCQREGNELCSDCLSLIEAPPNQYCPFCHPAKIVLDGRTCNFCRQTRNLDGLHNAASYQNFIIKKAISQFKYQPYVKELSKPLSSLIIKYFQLIEHPVRPRPFSQKSGVNRAETVLIPVPLAKKKLKQRGFNQAEEIAKELSSFLEIPLISNVLVKIKETSSQVELSGSQRDKSLTELLKEAKVEKRVKLSSTFHPSLRSGKTREENVKGVFFCKNSEPVKGRKIFLVDDVFTTGSTMEECARVLKNAGAREVWGIVVARE